MATIVITLDGEEYRITSGSLTALDAKEFRAKVGMGLTEVFTGKAADLDVLAGLVWLAKRKRDPSVTFEKVAQRITYDSELEIVQSNGEAPEAPDPET